MKRVLLTVVVVLVVEALLALYVRSSGMVNVSALSPPSAFEEWFLGGASDASIEAHAEPVPSIDHNDRRLINEGLEHYNEMCVACHSAPGLGDSEIAKGLNPPAPHLWTEDSQEMSDAELFWVVKNGIRATGMPAFGPTHGDDAIRAIVAFLRKLPYLKGGRYAQMVRSAGLEVPGEDDDEAHEHEEGGAHRHGHHHGAAHEHEGSPDDD